MTITTWGPALEAEITYRQEQARQAWPQRRRTPRRARPARPGSARQAASGPVLQAVEAPSAATPLRAVADGGARRRSLPGSEAWPAA